MIDYIFLTECLIEWATYITKILTTWATDGQADCATGYLICRKNEWLSNWVTVQLGTWLVDRMTDWATTWLTVQLGTWPADRMTDWATDWLTVQLGTWPPDRMTDWATDWLADWLTVQLGTWLADRMTDWAIDWMTDWLQATDWLGSVISRGQLIKIIQVKFTSVSVVLESEQNMDFFTPFQWASMFSFLVQRSMITRIKLKESDTNTFETKKWTRGKT